jgi:MFS family permease
MDLTADVTSIAHVIQLSVAPVFLLTGVGAMIAVLTNRLGRAVDRARALEARYDTAAAEVQATLRSELRVLERRSRMIYAGMLLCALCALLVCSVIVGLFASTITGTAIAPVIGALFVAAMFAFMGALVAFLLEVHLALRTLHIGPP